MKTIISSLILILIVLGAALGAPPNILNYQGRVAVSGVNFDGTGQFKFALTNGESGAGQTYYWNHEGTLGEPTTALPLTVTKGLYSVQLGDTAISGMAAIPASVFTDHDAVYLRVWFGDGGVGGLQLLSPDQRITSVGYALSAAQAESVADGAVTEAMLADNAVTNAKIGNGAVNAAKLANNAVTSAKIAAGAVTTSDLAAGAVTNAKLADNAVTSSKIAPAFFQATAPDTGVMDLVGSPGAATATVVFDRPFEAVPDVSVAAGWTVSGVSETGFSATISFAPGAVHINNVFRDTDVIEFNGRPAIAYQQVTGVGGSGIFGLKFAIASDAAGTSWNYSTVTTGPFTGYSPSLAVVDGRPAVSYFDATTQTVNYVIAQDALGASWGTPVVVANAGNPSVFPEGESALALVTGRPAICFYDITAGQLKYVMANDATGASWGTPVIVDAAGGVSPSLVIVDGRPGVAYSRAGLKFARAGDGTGAIWGTAVPVAAGGQGPTLAIVNGRPAISHLNGSAVEYVRASDVAGSAWGGSATVDSSVSEASLAVVAGRPSIAFYDDAARDIKFAMAQDADGSAWGSPIAVEAGLGAPSGPYSSGFVSMAVADQGAMLAYYDHASPFSLKYARIPLLENWTAGDSVQDIFVPVQATGVVDGGVTAASLAGGAVTSTAIADGAVTSAGIADGTITAADLDTGSIGLWSVNGPDIYRTSGWVGIGTANPTRALHIQSATNGVIQVDRASDAAALILNRFDTADTSFAGVPWRSFTVGVAASDASTGDFVITDNTAGVRRLTIKQDGKVGIGTTSPARLLHVQDPGSQTGFIQVGGTGANGSPKLISFGDGLNVTIGENGSDDTMELRAGRFYFKTGNVGIGTETPTKGSLQIDSANGFVPAYNPAGFLDTSGAHNGSISAGGGISLWAASWVYGASFAAFSDERIKNIRGRSDRAADLESLLGIEITDYTFKDTIAKGDRPQKKVIAQQVEEVYPQAVNRSTNEVPDIYESATLTEGWVELATDLETGERVKLIGEKEQGVYEVLETREGAFRTAFAPGDGKVFVYGREVDDFRSVDYEAISMLNVSATQELARRIEAQEAENDALRRELAALKAKDAARDAKLAAIEEMLRERAPSVARTAVVKTGK